VGERILANWEASVEKFVRVMPREFARVLRERQHSEVEQMSHMPE
jgi:glutamate synthase domain-containing protein 3